MTSLLLASVTVVEARTILMTEHFVERKQQQVMEKKQDMNECRVRAADKFGRDLENVVRDVEAKKYLPNHSV